MELKEAMALRHTVRKFTDQPIDQKIIEQLNHRIDENNKKLYLSLKLVNGTKSVVNWLGHLVVSSKNAMNYIILAGDKKHEWKQNIGYAAADLMLYAQTLGLNSWYIGATFKKSVKKLVNNKPVVGVLVIGYGQTQGVAHKSKAPEAVSRYEGDQTPIWFQEGVQAALLAPTALNRQKFMLIGHGNKVKLEMNLDKICANEDYGLIKYHFELGAGKDNFIWDK